VVNPLGATRQPVQGDHSFAGTFRWNIEDTSRLGSPFKNPRDFGLGSESASIDRSLAKFSDLQKPTGAYTSPNVPVSWAAGTGWSHCRLLLEGGKG
jgi:hypothetical protein